MHVRKISIDILYLRCLSVCCILGVASQTVPPKYPNCLFLLRKQRWSFPKNRVLRVAVHSESTATHLNILYIFNVNLM